jgi:hypothetical protein
MNSFVNFKTSRHGTALGLAIIVGVIVVVGSVITLLAPGPARAKPEFAAQTKLPCARCHTAPAGGKELTDFGKEFKDNGFKLKN